MASSLSTGHQGGAASPVQPSPRLAVADVTARLKQLSGLRDEGQRLVSLSFAQTVHSSPPPTAGDARRGGELLETAQPGTAAPLAAREGQWVVSTMAGFRTLAAAGFVEPQPSEAQRRGKKVETALRHLRQLQDRATELLTPTRQLPAAGTDP